VVKKSTLANSDLTWFIIGRPNGQRVRAWFASKEKATAEATERNIKIRKLEQESVKLDYNLISMATEGQTELRPFGKSIRDAVNFYKAHLTRTSASVSFSTLAEEFRAHKLGKPLCLLFTGPFIRSHSATLWTIRETLQRYGTANFIVVPAKSPGSRETSWRDPAIFPPDPHRKPL
jgi:hypothetical protein